MCLFLKKEDLGSASKGTITLVLEVIYNQVRLKVNMVKFVANIDNIIIYCEVKNVFQTAVFFLFPPFVPGQGWHQNLPTKGDKINGGKPEVLQKGHLY